jgi:hypothetical protein
MAVRNPGLQTAGRLLAVDLGVRTGLALYGAMVGCAGIDRRTSARRRGCGGRYPRPDDVSHLVAGARQRRGPTGEAPRRRRAVGQVPRRGAARSSTRASSGALPNHCDGLRATGHRLVRRNDRRRCATRCHRAVLIGLWGGCNWAGLGATARLVHQSPSSWNAYWPRREMTARASLGATPDQPRPAAACRGRLQKCGHALVLRLRFCQDVDAACGRRVARRVARSSPSVATARCATWRQVGRRRQQA